MIDIQIVEIITLCTLFAAESFGSYIACKHIYFNKLYSTHERQVLRPEFYSTFHPLR